MKNKLKNKLQQIKDVMVCFSNSQRQFFFSQKRGSIAIEGAACTIAVFYFLAAVFNFFVFYNQVLLATRITEDLGISAYNARNATQVFLKQLVSQVMAKNGVKGSSATLATMMTNGYFVIRNYNYGGGCGGPNYGNYGQGVDQFLSHLVLGQGGGSNTTINGLAAVAAGAAVAVCVPPPRIYLDWATFGQWGYIMNQQQAGLMMFVIPKPPKNNKP